MPTLHKDKFTIVTAFFDIGRGDWNYYNRKTEEYLSHFSNMLSLDTNLIVFTEEKYLDFISQRRTNLDTLIIMKEIKDLYTYERYSDIIISNLSNNRYRENHPNPICPEVTQPLYNILVTNKMKFLEEAVSFNPFSTEYFFWMDGGYTHSTISLKDITWDISPLFNSKFSIMALSAVSPLLNPRSFFYEYRDPITGGFFGGRREDIRVISEIYYLIMDCIIDSYNITDDDQYYMTLLISRYPELFSLYFGGWYAGINLFKK